MGLGLSSGSNGAEYLPIVTWDARSGRLFRVDRAQDATGAWASNKADITNDRPTFVADFGAIEVGYLAFLPTGPSFQMVPLGSALPAKPSPDHKQGVRLHVFSPKFFGGLREFASSAKSVLGAIGHLHDTFSVAKEAAEGKVPVVQLDGSTAITTKGPNGNVTSYAPILKVVSWVDRPAELGERTVPAPGARATPAAVPVHTAPPANHVPPPVAPVAPPAVVAAAGMPDFGGGSALNDAVPFAAEWR